MRTIKGYEGYYHFDDKMNIVNTKTGFIKRPCVSSCNYLVIDLFRDGIRKTLLVHRLIAENFIENPMGFPEVNHKDGNRLNNSLSNLEWCNRSYNIKHSYDNLFRKQKMNWKKGKENHASKKVFATDKSGVVVYKFDCIMDAERELGIRNNSIVSCLKGHYKTAGGLIWHYA